MDELSLQKDVLESYMSQRCFTGHTRGFAYIKEGEKTLSQSLKAW